jgi:4-aminobutyrate aminotransferase
LDHQEAIMKDAVSALIQRDEKVIAGIEKLRFFPLAVVAGQGCWLTEAGGRPLLDLSASWAANGLGHGHPAIVAAVTAAVTAAPGASCLSAVHPGMVDLAETLLELVPGCAERSVYLGLTGTDANEAAVAACRHGTGRRRVIAFAGGYHGGFGVAKQLSGIHIDAGGEVDRDLALARYPAPYRAGRMAPESEDILDDSLMEIRHHLMQNDVACVIVEPILSDGGMIVPPPGFLSALQNETRAHGALLICDEVKVGLGRTGVLHAFQRDSVVPDFVTLGKSLGGGLPISAVVGPRWLLEEPGASAMLTLAGNPVSVAAARAVLHTLIADDLPARAGQAGARLRAGLVQALDGVAEVGDIRGAGLALGIELVTAAEPIGANAALARQVVYRAWELGAVFYYVGGNVLELTPPLIISDSEIDQAIDIVNRAIRDSVAGLVDGSKVDRFAGW